MICPKCGSQNPDNANYCVACGINFTSIKEQQVDHQLKQQIRYENSGASSKNKMIIPILIFLILGVIFFILIFEIKLFDSNPVMTTTTTLSVVTTSRVTTTSTTTTTTTTTTLNPEFNVVPNSQNRAIINLKSEPDHASIYLDNNYVGVTPKILQVSEGDHSISLQRTGYTTYSKKFDAKLGNTINIDVDFNKIDSNYVKVTFISDPEGAQVLLDNKPYGFTPLTIDRLFKEEYQVRMAKVGFVEYNRVVKIDEAQTISINLTKSE